MAAWRRTAIDCFPKPRRDLNDPSYSIYQLFFDLLPEVREAHRERQDEHLRQIYGFAEWCIRQKTHEPLDAAVTAFYEHLFDEQEQWEQVIAWLSPYAIEGCLPFWESSTVQWIKSMDWSPLIVNVCLPTLF